MCIKNKSTIIYIYSFSFFFKYLCIVILFVSAESHESIEKLSDENDSKTALKHHVSTYIIFKITPLTSYFVTTSLKNYLIKGFKLFTFSEKFYLFNLYELPY